jgi:hypothetical protein
MRDGATRASGKGGTDQPARPGTRRADHAFDLVLRPWANASTTTSASIPAQLEAETGQSVTWHGCGSFRLAYTEDEMDWLRHTLSVGRALQLQHRAGRAGPGPRSCIRSTISTAFSARCTHRMMAMSTRPASPMALAIGARAKGAKIIRRCRATNITQLPTGEWKVDRAGRYHLRTCGQCRRHLCAPDGRMVRPAAADDLDDPPLLRHRHGAGVPESRKNCRSSAMTSWCPAISAWSRRRA